MVQEVFTRLWGHRQQYAGRSTLKTYVLGYANKIFREEQRRRRRTKALADYFSQNPPRGAAEPARPELEVVRAELRESLDRAIARLTVGHQQAVRLYYAERMSLEKAAQAAGCTRKCFASRLLRARRALRDLLKGSS
jgi:RNA polymerase sigma factor (sigma-70 family)